MQSSLVIKPLTETEYEIAVRAPDFVGLLSIITGFFASSGISILRGDIKTVDKQAVDLFNVYCPAAPDWGKFQEEFLALLEKARTGPLEPVHSEIRGRMIRFLRTQKGYQRERLNPIDLAIDQDCSETETVVEIRAQDTTGFLYELTNALSLLGINIALMEIETVRGEVHDRLWLTYEGKKILSEEKLKAVQWAILLVKQFTHLLPRVPDPDAALQQFALLGKDVFERGDFGTILSTLQRSNVLEDLSRVLGTSRFLWEEFIRIQYESLMPVFGNEKLLKRKKTRAEMRQELEEILSGKVLFDGKVEALNEFKDREMFRIDLRHILGRASYLGEFAEEFTDLVEAVTEISFGLAWEQAAKKYAEPRIDENDKSTMAVFGLGKFGGRELGYASDLEILFVYRDAPDSASDQVHQNLEFYTELVRFFRKIIRARSEGVFEIDLRLRPHGGDGPLACSVNAFKQYYSAGGAAWNFERQALIKLRSITGDAKIGEEIEQARDTFVYSEQPFDFKEALRLRVKQQKEHILSGTLSAKFSPGGLLDVEYLVQTLQIAYGRKLTGDVRHPNTSKAMRALWQAGVLSEKQFQDLRAAYVFLRNLINALRIVRGHAKDLTIPKEDSEEFIILGRRMGITDDDAKVRTQFKIFCRYYMETASNLYETWMQQLADQDWQKIPDGLVTVSESLRVNLDNLLRGELTERDARVLQALGFSDIPDMVNRMKRLCPSTPAFEYFAKVMDRSWPVWEKLGDPSLAVKHLEWYVDNISDKDVFWKLLSESERWFPTMITIFGSSRYLSDMLIKNPEDFFWIQHPEHCSLARTKVFLNEIGEHAVPLEELRKLRHRETLRIVLAEIIGGESLEAVFETYSDLADFVIDKVGLYSFGRSNYCVIGIGKLGGRELNFSSDIDLMFVVPQNGATQDPVGSVQRFLNAMKEGSLNEFLYRVDLRLRPHGEQGALFLTPEEYIQYYRKQADAWEHQVLIKARPVGGRKEIGENLLAEVDSLIWREVWMEADLEHLREVKRRYERRTQTQGESETNIKMGLGGIRDIEFSIQMIQLLSGGRIPFLRQRNSMDALGQIRAKGLLGEKECDALREGYRFLRRIENRLHLYENRQVFNLPEDPAQRKSLARMLGFFDSDTEKAEVRFANTLKNTMQSSREIFEKVFYSKDRNR
ncbi:MAG: hypothetical protein PHN49_03970 [Candidatus Omnitrophica bacterium]|nr:hypothetical protein [Candidatus Omnitrophota bacterium]MDD5670777.1 hypothetical protein [Candidatus Omnitrophota bacterium]